MTDESESTANDSGRPATGGDPTAATGMRREGDSGLHRARPIHSIDSRTATPSKKSWYC